MSELQVEIISDSLRELQQGECPMMSILFKIDGGPKGRPEHEQSHHQNLVCSDKQSILSRLISTYLF